MLGLSSGEGWETASEWGNNTGGKDKKLTFCFLTLHPFFPSFPLACSPPSLSLSLSTSLPVSAVPYLQHTVDIL